MAGSDIISQHWKEQQKIFQDNLTGLRLNFTGKAIHDLRVAIKKLRSYLGLFNLMTGPDEAGLQLADTETLFNITGKYRDIEISIEVLDFLKPGKKNHYSSLQSYLQSAFHLSEQKISNPLKKFKPGELQSIADVINTRLSLENNDELMRKADEVVKQRLVAIIELSKTKNEQPHELRKQLKILYYWLMLLPEGLILSAAQMKKLNKMLDQLGSWQDHQVLLTRTRHFRKDFVPKKTEEFRSIKKLEEQLSVKSKKILETTGKQLIKLLDAIEKRFKSKSPEMMQQ